MRGRAYSFGQPSSVYPVTPYSGYNSLPVPYYNNNPGMSRSANYYIAPSAYGRSRSHSRPRRSHHRSSSHHHSQSRRSRSHQRPSSQTPYRYPVSTTTSAYSRTPTNHSPSLGARILNFFGLGNSNRYVDQYGRSVDSRGRSKHKY
jgi:hypothetical protein